MMARRPAALLAACTAVLALLAAGCGGGSGGEALPVLDDFALVADSTQKADSARFEMEMEMSMPMLEQPVSFTAAGAFDNASRRASMEMDLGGLMSAMGDALGGGDELGKPEDWRLEMRMDGDQMFMRMPLLARELPAGKSWVRVDLEEAARLQGTDVEQLRRLAEGNDPRDTLEALRAVTGGLTRVGEEDVRGVQTTHYQATVDWERYARLAEQSGVDVSAMLSQLRDLVGAGGLPVDVWVDGDYLVRRMRVAMAMTPPGQSERVEASFTMDLFDYGTDVAVELPAASEVADLADLKR